MDYLGLRQGILDGVGSNCGNPALKDCPLEETFCFWRQSLFRIKFGLDEQQRRTGTLALLCIRASRAVLPVWMR